jgi:hypothetical protein
MSEDELDQESRERLHRFLEESTHHPLPDGFETRVVPDAHRQRQRPMRVLAAATVFALVGAGTVSAILVTRGGTAGSSPNPAAPTATPGPVDLGTALENLAAGVWTGVTPPSTAPVSPPYSSSGVPVLVSIACPSNDDCWAVGRVNATSGLIEHYDGSAWSVVSEPAAGLVSVSCPSADDCWAVGTTLSKSKLYEPAIEQYSGGRWVGVQGPPLGSVGTLSSVTCSDVDHCWAVGSIGTIDAGGSQPVIEAFDGTGWAVVSGPPLTVGAGTAFSTLNGVICVTSDDCWAVGEGASSNIGLIEHFDGSGWTVVSGATTPGGAAGLQAVACTGVSNCWAVGGNILEQYDGTTWSNVRNPLTGAASPGLVSVACDAVDDCWAVGDTITPAVATGWDTLVEHWQGSAWSPVTSLPVGLVLEGVACPGSDDCWAVGAVYGVGPSLGSPSTSSSATASSGDTPPRTGAAG